MRFAPAMLHMTKNLRTNVVKKTNSMLKNLLNKLLIYNFCFYCGKILDKLINENDCCLSI